MGKSRYKLTGGKKNGFASFPKTLVEAIFWDKKKQPLEETLDGKIDAPNDPALAGKIPQVGQDGKIEWVDPLAAVANRQYLKSIGTISRVIIRFLLRTIRARISSPSRQI